MKTSRRSYENFKLKIQTKLDILKPKAQFMIFDVDEYKAWIEKVNEIIDDLTLDAYIARTSWKYNSGDDRFMYLGSPKFIISKEFYDYASGAIRRSKMLIADPPTKLDLETETWRKEIYDILYGEYKQK
ncbi:unnamed protein product [marine sediment metagenome]|uniref:Uncharacterized protein n=1 Tax=marine sediment metagenome TaxID=412755 RepID=X1E5H3_9ZZZZ